MLSPSTGTTAGSKSARLLSEVAGALVFVALAAYGLHFARFGIDLSDEGLMLSSASRYALGDVPFRDEIAMTPVSSDVLLWPLFEILGDPTVLQIRYLGVLLQWAGMLGFYLLLKRYAPAYLVALASAATAFMTIPVIWTPGYNIVSGHCLFLAVALWLLGAEATSGRLRTGLGLAAGLFFFLAAFAYLPLLASLAVPATIFGAALARRQAATPFVRVTATLLATVAGLLVVTVTFLAAAGLAGAWLENMRNLRGSFGYDFALSDKVYRYLRQALPRLPLILSNVGLIALAAVSLPREKRPLTAWLGLLVPPGLAILTLVLVLHTGRPEERHHAIVAVMSATFAITLTSVIAMLRSRSAWNGHDARWHLVYGSAAGVLLTASGIQALSSTNGFYNSNQMLGPVFTLGIVALGRSLFRLENTDGMPAFQRALPRATLAAFCAAYAFVHLSSRATTPHRERPTPELTASFAHPLLAGVRSTPERVAAIEGTLEYLDGRLERGETLLEYGLTPIFYYLTHTRPALARMWYPPYFPHPEKSRLVERMIREGRTPRYCIVTRVFPKGIGGPREDQARWRLDPQDPIYGFITSHYERVETVFPFEIWRRLDSRAPQ